MPTETLHADAVLLNNACVNPQNAQGAADGVWTGNTDQTNWDCRWSLANPTSPLTAGATHTLAVLVRKSASGGNGDPTIALELFDNGTLVKTLVATTAVTSATGVTLSGTFTTAEVSSGANVEARAVVVGVAGAATGRRNAQIDAFTFTADVSGATVVGSAVQTVWNAAATVGTAATLAWDVHGRFRHYRDVTVDNAGGAAKTDWPVRINLSSANFDFTKTRADGGDVELRTVAGTLLPFWVERWDAAALVATIWVRVASLAAGGTATVRLWYGADTAVGQQNPTETFSWHAAFDAPSELRGALNEPDGIVLANRDAYPQPVTAVAAGTWKAEQIREPSNVIYRGGAPDGEQYAVLYTGVAAGSGDRIGVTFSADGLTWVDYASNPVLPAAEDAYIGRATDGSLHLVGGTHAYVWFERKAGEGGFAGQDGIGLARTTDFKTWEVWNGVAWSTTLTTHVNVVPLGAAGAWDERYTASPLTIWDGSQWVMVYEGYSDANGDQTGVARSADGITWTKEATNPVTAVDVPDDAQLIDGTWWFTFHNTAGNQRRLRTTDTPATWTSTSFVEDGRAPIDSGNSLHPFPSNVPANRAGLCMFMPNTTTPQAMHLWDFAGGGTWRAHHQSGITNSSSPYAAELHVADKRMTHTTVDGMANTVRTKTSPLPTSDMAVRWAGTQTNTWQNIGIGQGALIASVPFPMWADGYSIQDDNGTWKLREYGAGAYTGDLATLVRDVDMTVRREQELRYRADGTLTYVIDGVTKLSAVDATHAALGKGVLLSVAGHTGVLGSRQYEFVLARKFDGVDPATTVGAETTVLTVVGRAVAAAWNTTAVVTAARAVVWNASAAVGLARAVPWDTTVVVAQLRVALWDVRTPVGLARQTVWDVAAAAGQQRRVAWHVEGYAARAVASVWDVRQTAARAPPIVWDVHAAAGLATVALWTVRALERLWPDTDTPVEDPDTTRVTLGTRFTVAQAGVVRRLRFYETANCDGTVTLKLWRATAATTATELASATFTATMGQSGWRDVNLATPVDVVPTERYVVSYNTPRYAAEADVFTVARVSGNLTAQADDDPAGYRQGLYAYTTDTTVFPTNTWDQSAYFADVVYEVSEAGPVGRSTSAVWTTRATIADTHTALWDTTVPVGQTRQTVWNVAAATGEQRQAVWDVRRAVAGARQAVWTTSARVDTARAALWNVNGLAAAARAALWDIAAAVAQARTALWNVTSTAAQARQTVWNVAAGVGAPRTALWDIRGAVGDARQAVWMVRAAVAEQRTAVWNVATTTAAARSALWDVAAAAGTARQTVWDVRTVAAVTRSGLWDVRATAGLARAAVWGVAAAVAANRQAVWNVHGLTAVARAALWDVRAAIGQTRQVVWDTQATAVVGVERAALWDVRAAVAQTRQTVWNAASTVGEARQTRWDIAQTAAQTRAAVWDVAGTAAAARDLRWDVTVTAGQPRTALWDVAAPAGQQRQTVWTTAAAVAQTRVAVWAVLETAATARVAVWAVNTAVTQPRTALWTTAAVVTRTRTAVWDVRGVAGLARQVVWDVAGAAVTARTAVWNTATTVGQTRVAVWDVRGAVGQLRTVVWDVAAISVVGVDRAVVWSVAGTTVTTRTAVWDVNAAAAATKAVVWDVRGGVAAARQVPWDVRADVGQARAALWNIGGAATRTVAAVWNTAGLTATSRTAVWTVRTTVADTHAALWDTGAGVARHVAAVWDVGGFAARPLAALWTVRTGVPRTVDVPWTVRTIAARQTAALWDVATAVGGDTTAVWTVTARIAVDRTALWTVHVTAAQTRGVVWHVTAAVGQGRTVVWAVAAPTGQHVALAWSVAAVIVHPGLTVVVGVPAAPWHVGDTATPWTGGSPATAARTGAPDSPWTVGSTATPWQIDPPSDLH